MQQASSSLALPSPQVFRGTVLTERQLGCRKPRLRFPLLASLAALARLLLVAGASLVA